MFDDKLVKVNKEVS
jgi:predicted  nucleic acid-binding Zn-ribbon protein